MIRFVAFLIVISSVIGQQQQPYQPRAIIQPPNQPQYGQQPPNQPQYGQQPPNQPQYGQQPPNQPQYNQQQQQNPNQQYFAQNQYQNNNGQYQRPPGFVNNQLRTANNFADGDKNATGAIIRIQLRSYSNPSLMLPNGMTCTCPASRTCPYLRTAGSQCYFSFTIIISAPDQSVQYMATDFLPLTNVGTIDVNQVNSNWSIVQTLNLTAKPSSIDIFVHHLGVVINQQTGALEYFNYLVHADTFVQSLTTYLPSATSNMQPAMTETSLIGQIIGSRLTLSYSVQCSTFMGPNCDMTCVQSTSDSTMAICQDQNGVYSQCQYQSGRLQVDNCKACTYGATNSSCISGGYSSQPTVTTSNAFRTWTIILGCLLGIAIIFIIAMIVFYIIVRNKEEPPAYRSSTWSQQPASRPLLSEPKQHNFKRQSNDNHDAWGYQPHVAATQRSAAPMAEHETSRQSQSTRDDEQNSQSSYRPPAPGNNIANGGAGIAHPVSLARREAQV